MTTVPEMMSAQWIASLGDQQLIETEAFLHAEFVKEESAEKRRAGSDYRLLRGPAALVTAWNRWSLINNETQRRHVVVHRPPKGAQ